MKSGFIAIIGKPNAGKSTLLNSLLNAKLAITTHKAQTTRNSILGIYNDDDYQIVFVDTPGIHDAVTALGSYMNKQAMNQVEGADVIYYIIDGSKGLGKDDKRILDRLFEYDAPVFLLVNKIDEMNRDIILERLTYAAKTYDFAEIIPISALKKENLDDLLETSKQYLTDNVLYFPSDAITNTTTEFRIAEAIREKIILKTYEEIPHLVAVKVDEIKEEENKVLIEASIICNKDTHKGIIIGHNGEMLKQINMSASRDIKKMYNKKVILSLYVKVEEYWLNKEKKLFDLGYFNE